MAVIRRAALTSQNDYAVRSLAEDIVGGLPSKDFLSEYLAIYYYVLSRTRYSRDPRTVELVRSPSLVAKELAAGKIPSLDCDDMAALICALILAVGGQCRIVTVAFRDMFYRGQRQYSHVFAQAREPRSGRWITLDPVAGGRTDEMHGRVVAERFWPVA
ncbi:MAG: transglutaminase-like domain-containing protein [Kiloniellales bacterium]|nr:transglutaminase-like domain-containing protein [Kiloniellales bacterium]